MKLESVILLVIVLETTGAVGSWPVEAKHWTQRPAEDPYCQYEKHPFCATGLVPDISPNDTLRVYYYTNPVMYAKYGMAFAHINAYHSLLAFESDRLRKNFTLEYYAKGSVMNTSFPQIRQEDQKYQFTWCQVTGSCLIEGIKKMNPHDGEPSSAQGYLTLLGTMRGHQFHQLMKQVDADNTTFPIYNGFNIQYEPEGQRWIDSIDCVDFVKRMVTTMLSVGANFSAKSIRVSKMTVYSERPQNLGAWAEVSKNASLVQEVVDFFKIGLPAQGKVEEFERFAYMLYQLFLAGNRHGFLHYNEQYWRLRLRPPFTKITYADWPIPSHF
ncbi:Ceroid-lipofuscinosis neuronal protein 5 [Cichlidogyrus casuarinus]|uniref:Bis(monoacylglycero)phosphate synthase CLN5 n=1 Tax=Cichlidogyrus casuarinus TaxID=1844966 RepID=A0ABD2PLE8_9PLAT